MKLLSEIIAPKLAIASNCTHIKGNGGLKQSVKKTDSQLQNYQFVCKTDVKIFYESIDQNILYEQICEHISNKILRYYLFQAIHRAIDRGSIYQDITQGISRGCPLSPLLGGLYLKAINVYFRCQKNLHYVRYMNDI